MNSKHWQITLWSKNITDDGKDHIVKSTHNTQEHPIKFRAYDSDNVFYCEGTASSDKDGLMSLILDTLQGMYGVVDLKLYNRKTGERFTGYKGAFP